MGMENVMNRICGSCKACCTVIGVDEIQKGWHTPCPNLCDKGCNIYSGRPKSCELWQCAWLSGWIDGDERRRPDKLGVIFEYRVLAGHTLLVAYEAWKGALKEPSVQYLLGKLRKDSDVVTVAFGNRRIWRLQRASMDRGEWLRDFMATCTKSQLR